MKWHPLTWDFWRINLTELLVLHLARNLLSVKGGDVVLAMYSVCVHSLAREKVFLYMNISKSPKDTKTTTFSQEINNFSKTEL